MVTYRKSHDEARNQELKGKGIQKAEKELFNLWMATYPVEHIGKKIPMDSRQYIDGKVRYT